MQLNTATLRSARPAGLPAGRRMSARAGRAGLTVHNLFTGAQPWVKLHLQGPRRRRLLPPLLPLTREQLGARPCRPTTATSPYHPAAGIVQGKATVRAVDRKTDFACFDIELPAERADNVVIGEQLAGMSVALNERLCS